MHKFISIEGIEGAGKSTAVKILSKYMLEREIDCIFTREPGGTELGEEIREILLYPASNEKLFPETELLLMFASRMQLINSLIKPALEMGKWVIADRYVDASYAYQGGGRGIAVESIESLDKIIVNGLYPQLTLLLDLPAEVGLHRANKRNDALDRIENEKISFFDRVRESYLARAKQFPDRIKVIDANLDIASVTNQIHQAIEQVIKS